MFRSLNLVLATIYMIAVLLFNSALGIVQTVTTLFLRPLGLPSFLSTRINYGFFMSYLILIGSTMVEPVNQTNEIVYYLLQFLAVSLYITTAREMEKLEHTHAGKLNFYERWFQKRMHRPGDVYFIEMITMASVATVPLFVCLFLPGALTIPVAIMYLSLRNQTTSLNEMLLHHNMHSEYFRTRQLSSRFDRFVFKAHQIYLDWILCPMSSMHPNYYRVHHNHNHHKEDGGLDDVTTLSVYDRSSFFDFCRAGWKFLWSWTFGFDLFHYLIRKSQRDLAVKLAKGILWTIAFVSLMFYMNPLGGMLFMIATIQGVAGITFSLWSWHAFVDSDNIDNYYTNSVNLSFNSYTMDAYHIEHHRKQAVHYSKYPELFVNNLERYRKEGSVMFRGIPNLNSYVFCILLKRFDILATHMVNLEPEPRSKKEIAELLESRTKSIYPQNHSRFYYWLENLIVNIWWRVSFIPLKSPVVNYSKDEVEGWSEKMETFFPGTAELRPFPLTLQYAKLTQSPTTAG